ncbi:DsrE/DsrF/DrsH-like family protein [Candidatus Hecatella orcuttiae]|uniref:DsrE/DsrF/DrsH-like family protein n=1 Tax=Candidatus Hecatella orcuttiae TaxID=1935119 RepID=UPI002867D180|nr:DsrE/DsrF/DrsH-like family protein [Candidatus Hecatella orcuttiae]
MSSGREKVALIVNSASYDRVSYALTIAVMSAALGREVLVLFTYGALRRLKKGSTDEVGGETEVTVRETVKQGLQKGSLQKISALLKDLKRFGGKVYACVSAMAFHNLTREELIEEVDQVSGIAAFLEAAKDASIMLYV